jgi:sulfite reductase (NADPH) flavoprotein alpha-component
MSQTVPQLLPASAPFSPDEIAALNGLVARATPLQRSWLSGFLAGLDAANAAAAPQPSAPPRAVERLLVLYGSETGNAEGLARKARKAAQKLGFDAKMLDMAEATPETLTGVRNLVVFAATWGEGDPPQRAAAFYRSLMDGAAPSLPLLRYCVLSLGDAAYANFCAAGRAIDARLAALGATRVAERLDLDLDYAGKAAAWTDAALAALAPEGLAQPPANVVRVDFKAAAHAEEREPAFDAENPLAAEIGEIVNLNGTGSTSETYHLELATDAQGWCYAPGDAIGVVPANDPELVAALLDAAGLAFDADVAARLVAERDVTTLTPPLVAAYARLTGREDVAALAAPHRFPAYAADRQIIDLLAEHGERLTAEQLTGLLRPLPGRLYSVASSLAAHPGETHLLVSAVRWRSHGRARNGVASAWLAGRRRGDTVKVYVKPNRHFRLPLDAGRPIIMIGAGTGVAPFRAFVEERAAAGALGKSWLFFGARNYTTDFLYQLEWQDHLASGALSRIDVAFSRDQPEKVYVQHRIARRAPELRSWIADGAYIYVCGDEKAMARAVDGALASAIGAEALDELRKAGRYLRDVY